MQARFDKQGNQLPDTGRGCGCQLCADSDAPRYERRRAAQRTARRWNPMRRLLHRMVHRLAGQRPQAA